jgi:hypothetical protein
VSIVARRVSGAGADAAGGWIRRGDRALALRDVALSTASAADAALPSSFVLELADEAGERHRIEGELPHVAPLPGFHGGREQLVHLAVATARLAGVPGAGFVEDRHQLDASSRSAEPVR